MVKIGKYIYGVIPDPGQPLRIECEAGQPFGPPDTSGSQAVYAVSFEDISALVSDSRIVDYRGLFKDELARLLVWHQKVIEEVMGLGYRAIPMRLGTFATDEVGVKEILDKGYGLIKQILSQIKDKIELEVVATWSNFDLILKEAGQEEEVRQFKEGLLSNPKGITVEDQMKAGAMVKKALEKKAQDYAKKIKAALKASSEDSRPHELMNDEMVANVAFLIKDEQQKEFDKKLQELNAQFKERLNFRCVGPLPPYSFYTLEVKRIEFEQIDWARKRLGLMGDFATKDEIEKAHKSLALSLHPDRNPHTPGMEKKFDELTKAYRTLCEYCQGDACSFEREGFGKNSLLVKVR